MSLCQREGFGRVFPVSEIGKKSAVSEHFSKPAPSILSKEGFPCGTTVCWIWPIWMVRLPVLLSALYWQAAVQWGNGRRVLLSGITFFLTTENSKILFNALCVPASSTLQTVLCIWRCFVCIAGKVKRLTLVLGEIALKFRNWVFETVSG